MRTASDLASGTTTRAVGPHAFGADDDDWLARRAAPGLHAPGRDVQGPSGRL
jgi:hypothetical protein